MRKTQATCQSYIFSSLLGKEIISFIRSTISLVSHSSFISQNHSSPSPLFFMLVKRIDLIANPADYKPCQRHYYRILNHLKTPLTCFAYTFYLHIKSVLMNNSILGPCSVTLANIGMYHSKYGTRPLAAF